MHFAYSVVFVSKTIRRYQIDDSQLISKLLIFFYRFRKRKRKSFSKFCYKSFSIDNIIDSIINSIIIREISTEKTIYFDSVEFTNNSAFTMSFDFVVQTIIDVSMIIMMTRIQQMINQNQSTIVIDFANSQEKREFFETTITVDEAIDTSRFVSKKIDFFNSRYQNKTTTKTFALKNIDENTIYRDVHVFIFKIKNYFHIYNYQFIRDNFYRCLQDDIFT